MELYADRLEQHLQPWAAQAGVSLQRVAPPVGHNGRPGYYHRRYFLYPVRMRRINAQLIQVLDHGYADLLWWLPPRRAVLTCHDLMPLRMEAFPSGTYRQPRSAFYRFRLYSLPAFRRAALIIAGSENTRRDVLHFTRLPAERVEVVPYGVDPVFRPLPNPSERFKLRHEHGFTATEKIVLHVGSSLFYKNVEGILRALARLRQEMPALCRLLKVGQPLTADQRALAESLGLAEAVREWADVNQERLLAAYQLADVLCFPSYYEGFGLPLIEAMACGLPVVTSNVSAPPEVVGDAALTVPPGDPEAIAEALHRVLTEDSLREELRQRGWARAGQFTWERTAQETWRVYRRVLEAIGSRE